jgi:hypothetical protein
MLLHRIHCLALIQSEEVKSAASYALGNVALGNLQVTGPSSTLCILRMLTL